MHNLSDNHIPDSIVVPSNDAPTAFNRDAVNGAIIGNVVGGYNHELLGTLIGGIIGSMHGKERMEREYREGHVVRKPWSMGADVAISAAAGGLLLGLFGALLPVTAPAILIAAGIGVALGAVTGFSNHRHAAHEYEKAKNYYIKHGGNYEGREREAQKAQGHQISPEEYAMLQQRLASIEQRSHTQDIGLEQQSITPAR